MKIKLFLVVLTFSVASYAQDDKTDDSFSEIRIPDRRTPITIQRIVMVPVMFSKMPGTYQSLSEQDVKRRSIGQDPSFILSETPSITAYSEAGNGFGNSYFRMRGMDQTKINITLNGVPLNEPEDKGVLFSNFSDLLNSLSFLEIQRGLGTAINGTTNYGGGIVFYSVPFEYSRKTSFGANYGSFNSSRLFGEFRMSKASDKRFSNKSFYVRASQVFSDGYRYNSTHNSQSAFLCGSLTSNRTNWKLTFIAGQQRNQLAWMGASDSLIQADSRVNTDTNERNQQIQTLTQLTNLWYSGKSRLNTSIYHTFTDENRDVNQNVFFGLPNTNEVYNYATLANLLGGYSNYTYTRNKLTIATGIHANTYQRQHNGRIKGSEKQYENTGTKNEFNTFLKGTFNLKRFLFFADFQFRSVSFDYAGETPFSKTTWNFFNPKGGFHFKFNNQSLAYYSVGRTGNEPTRNDLFGGNDNLISDSLGNPVLFIQTPEYVVDHEIGFKYESPKLIINANCYYMDFTNEIVMNGQFGMNGLPLTTSVGRSYRAGTEINLGIKAWNVFWFETNASLSQNRITSGTHDYVQVLSPEAVFNQQIRYDDNKWFASISARYQSKSFIDFTNTVSLKSYVLLNARVGYRFKKFEFGAYLNNLTNQKYYASGYLDPTGKARYFVQAPFNWSVSVKCSF